jgi:hypothetical protein
MVSCNLCFWMVVTRRHLYILSISGTSGLQKRVLLGRIGQFAKLTNSVVNYQRIGQFRVLFLLSRDFLNRLILADKAETREECTAAGIFDDCEAVLDC